MRPPLVIVYDGECPFCSIYARYVKLQQASRDWLVLANARDADNDFVRDVKGRGFNLDDGMVAIINGEYYHGAEALNVLALMSSRSDFFNRLNYRLFSSKTFSKVAYPFLRAGRNAALKLKNVRKIHS